jgi:hypothetical protein
MVEYWIAGILDFYSIIPTFHYSMASLRFMQYENGVIFERSLVWR